MKPGLSDIIKCVCAFIGEASTNLSLPALFGGMGVCVCWGGGGLSGFSSFAPIPLFWAKDQSTVVHGAEMTVDRCPLMSLSICWILACVWLFEAEGQGCASLGMSWTLISVLWFEAEGQGCTSSGMSWTLIRVWLIEAEGQGHTSSVA